MRKTTLKTAVIGILSLPFVAFGTMTVPGSVEKEVLMDLNRRIRLGERRIGDLESRCEKLLPYGAEVQIENLRNWNTWIIALLTTFSVVITVFAGWRLVQAEVAMRTAKARVMESLQKARLASEKAEQAIADANDTNRRHQAYNSRFYHSLARQFELLSDMIPDVLCQAGGPHDLLRLRVSMLQTAFLYYDEALRYCMEIQDADTAFVNVKSLGDLYGRLKRDERWPDIGYLKKDLLKRYRWNYSAQTIGALLRKSAKGVLEVATVIESYRTLVEAVGGTPRA